MTLEVRRLNFSYGPVHILKDINLTVGPGVTGLIGPNGAGKSTLIKCISGALKPTGDISFDNHPIGHGHKSQSQVQMSYLPQTFPSSAVMTVFEMVLLGMLHSLSLRVSDEEVDKAYGVLRLLEIEQLADRQLCELSGGQQQLVAIAQVLVKDPRLILLDEPLNSLDIRHQLELLSIVKSITATRGIVTLVALHDLNLAARYANEMIVIHNGRISSCGRPARVLSTEMLQSIYKVKARIIHDTDGTPFVCPIDVSA